MLNPLCDSPLLASEVKARLKWLTTYQRRLHSAQSGRACMCLLSQQIGFTDAIPAVYKKEWEIMLFA